MTGRVVSYTDWDAPEVEVLHHGTWCFGTLHEWRQGHDGSWSGWVRYTIGIGQTLIGVIDQDQLRPFEPAHGPDEANGRPPFTCHTAATSHLRRLSRPHQPSPTGAAQHLSTTPASNPTSGDR